MIKSLSYAHRVLYAVDAILLLCATYMLFGWQVPAVLVVAHAVLIKVTLMVIREERARAARDFKEFMERLAQSFADGPCASNGEEKPDA